MRAAMLHAWRGFRSHVVHAAYAACMLRAEGWWQQDASVAGVCGGHGRACMHGALCVGLDSSDNTLRTQRHASHKQYSDSP